nr:DUF3971 domain-containing protein [Sulfitobacter algicola]
MDFRLKLDPFTLDFGQIVLNKGDTTVQANGQAKAAQDGWQVSLDANVTQLTPDEILGYWPTSFKPKTRNWFENNVLAGRLSDGHAALRVKPNEARVFTFSGDYDQASLRYMKTLPVVQNAKGHMTLKDYRLVIIADQGQVIAPQGGRISAAGTVFEIPDVRIKQPPANIMIRTNSTITAALAVLDEKPFEFLTKANQPVDLADGRAKLAIDIALRLKQGLTIDDVIYSAGGTLTSVRSDHLIKDRILASQNLSVSVTPNSLKVFGRARLGQVPVDATWALPLGPDNRAAGSRVDGTVELSERFSDEFGIALPAGSLNGAGLGRFSLNIPKGRPVEFQVTSDLQGLGLQLRDLGWSKPQNRSGRLAVAGVLGNPARIDQIEIESDGFFASGSVALNENGTMSAARFSRVRVEDWLDAPVTLNGRGVRQVPEIVISSGRIDLRKTTFGDQGGTGEGGPMRLALDELVVSDSISLTDLRGNFSAQGAFNGRFSAKVNGGAPINGILAPSEAGTAIRVTSDDAGGVLRSAGLLKQARRGNLDLTLRPARQDGRYNGRLLVTDTRIQNAPALAGILSAVSIVGLLDQMANSGILFSEVEANFVLTPNQVILTQSSAVGPSMGISMDGIYNLNTGRMDMQGVLSPIYMVNSIGSILTRRGEGLIGFNFNMRGTASDPSVVVNPLSALTPGMFREIFRRPPPSVPQ